jgi:hypothetical protein
MSSIFVIRLSTFAGGREVSTVHFLGDSVIKTGYLVPDW